MRETHFWKNNLRVPQRRGKAWQKCRSKGRKMVSWECVRGAWELSLIDAIIAPSATNAFSKWTTTVLGSQTASDFTTTSISSTCCSTPHFRATLLWALQQNSWMVYFPKIQPPNQKLIIEWRILSLRLMFWRVYLVLLLRASSLSISGWSATSTPPLNFVKNVAATTCSKIRALTILVFTGISLTF